MSYTDILYGEHDGVATITINREDRLNAFRAKTVDELIDAFNRAGWNKSIGACEHDDANGLVTAGPID